MGKEKTLGMARKTRQYDLPLNKGAGTAFLTTLIGLMSFLAVMSLAASFTLSAMTKRWSAGLENKVTIEIPAQMPGSAMLSPESVREAAGRIEAILAANPAVASAHALSDEEIKKLVEPWLGDAELPGGVPLPGLVSAELKNSEPQTIETLKRLVQGAQPGARVDTHEEWLGDLLRFTGALQFAAAVLTVVIGLITLTAVGGAVRSRMEVHHAEVELLHLMGASDNYIAKQFQRHALIMALQGSVIGALAGAAAMAGIAFISGEMGVNLLPDFTLEPLQIALLCLVPPAAAFIAAMVSQRTVIRSLKKMP